MQRLGGVEEPRTRGRWRLRGGKIWARKGGESTPKWRHYNSKGHGDVGQPWVPGRGDAQPEGEKEQEGREEQCPHKFTATRAGTCSLPA